MNKKIAWTVGIIVIIIVVVWVVGSYSGWWSVYSGSQTQSSSQQIQSTSTADMIRVDMPLADVLVQSPLIVKGAARGPWYFEASFPVKIFDSNGQLLGQVAAQAQGDWTTTDYVPFQATLIFATSTTETGTVVFQKDNPSGLPQNDAAVKVPVYFLENASKL